MKISNNLSAERSKEWRGANLTNQTARDVSNTLEHIGRFTMHFDKGEISRIDVLLDYIPRTQQYHIYSFDTMRKGNKKLPNNEDIYESSLDIARVRFQWMEESIKEIAFSSN